MPLSVTGSALLHVSVKTFSWCFSYAKSPHLTAAQLELEHMAAPGAAAVAGRVHGLLEVGAHVLTHRGVHVDTARLPLHSGL